MIEDMNIPELTEIEELTAAGGVYVLLTTAFAATAGLVLWNML